MNNKITILFPYFGKFPEWIELFIETLKCNSTINFIFYTDCDFNGLEALNIQYKKMSFDDYINRVRFITKLNFNPRNSYKICDLRPLFGLIHFDDIKDSDYYGYADLDLIFGDIRSFYTDEILEKYDVFSTHENIISGHFTLFKNTKFNREMYLNIGGWIEKIESQDHVGIDESIIHTISKYKIPKRILNYNLPETLFKPKSVRMYLKEQYTTPFTPIPWIDGTLNSNQPDTWYYKNGIISNNRDEMRNFIYLHLMNFKSSQYRFDGTKAPWEGKQNICFANVSDMKEGIVINVDGIFPINKV